MNDPPLLEGTGSTRGGSSIASESTTTESSSGFGSESFAITIQTADGSHTIDAEELLVYASLVQTLLFLAITYQQLKS